MILCLERDMDEEARQQHWQALHNAGFRTGNYLPDAWQRRFRFIEKQGRPVMNEGHFRRMCRAHTERAKEERRSNRHAERIMLRKGQYDDLPLKLAHEWF